MKNSKNPSIPEIMSGPHSTTGGRTSFHQYPASTNYESQSVYKRSLLQLKSSKLQNRSQNLSYSNMQTKLKKVLDSIQIKTNSQERKSYNKISNGTANMSFDNGFQRLSEKHLNGSKTRNRSLSHTRNNFINPFEDSHKRSQVSSNQEYLELKKENEDLKQQIKEFQRLDEQHKEIQKLLRQQIDCQQKFFQQEVSALKQESVKKVCPNRDASLEDLFQKETHHLASLLQQLPIQKSTYQKLLQTMSHWLEQLFFQVGKIASLKQPPLSQNPKNKTQPHQTIISENDSQIDIGQLINFNEESDMLEWDSPQVSNQRNCTKQANYSSQGYQEERFCTDRSDASQKNLRRQPQRNKENFFLN